MPPTAVADVAEDTDVVLPELLLLAPLDELLPHPAAKTRLPIAAVAAIAYFPRKVFPPVPRPYVGRKPSILARSSTSWLDKLT
jgi:hypothetical protein